jgi:signal transduction histidine kinase
VLQREPIDLGALLGEVLDLYESDPRLNLVRRVPAGLPSVLADRGRLRQVLHNLLKNAIEASADAAEIAIEAAVVLQSEGATPGIALQISDRGAGLPPGFDEQWFEPYRTTKPKGTGLGLAIVAKIAQEHGGRLEARERSEGGAHFSLWLPLT